MTDGIPASHSGDMSDIKGLKMVILTTDQLISAYPNSFESAGFDDQRAYYIETRTPENRIRDNRYIATMPKSDIIPSDKIENNKVEYLASIEGNDIWYHLFTIRDLEAISEAISQIQSDVKDDSKEEVDFKRRVVLEDGEAIQAEWIPYEADGTEVIVRGLENKDIAE